MLQHDDAFDLKFAPEFAGQVDEEENTPPEDGPTHDDYGAAIVEDDSDDEDDSEDYEDEEYEDEEESDDEADEESDDGQGEALTVEVNGKTVPLSQYNELRKFATQKSMELAAIKKAQIANLAPASVGQPDQPAPIKGGIDDLVASKVNQALEQVLAPLREQEEDLALQAEILRLSEKDENFAEVSPLFLQTLEENPDLFNIKNGMSLAYEAARASYLERVSSARVKAETTAALKQKEMKASLSDGSSQTRPRAQSTRTEADNIRDSILGAATRKPF